MYRSLMALVLLCIAVDSRAQDIKTWHDIAYGDAPAQRLDVYAPVHARGAPIVVMVHGGGWTIGDKRNPGVTGLKQPHWNAAGYVFVSIDYRMLPTADVVVQTEDVGRALAYVQKHAGAWGGDGRRLILMGHSAGAHLVALLAADPQLAYAQGAASWLGTVALDSAAYNVPRIMTLPHAALYDRVFGKDEAYWRKVSPLDRLHGSVQPLLLVCSSERLLSCMQARTFADAVLAKGGRAQVQPEALTHAQINAELGGDSDYTRAVDTFFRWLGLP
ncbi:MAG TPA: alpha/beta hydrolase [Dyella sp.]|uniref:alpha/beta hydrolase n=1 Tax=Dyella sp. TaxID=1869338 RepID=UPI002F9532AE